MEVVQPDKWYLTIVCHHCRQQVAVMLDPNQGDEAKPVFYERPVQAIICALCKQRDDYPISELRRTKSGPARVN